jgi:hypothetical protein
VTAPALVRTQAPALRAKPSPARKKKVVERADGLGADALLRLQRDAGNGAVAGLMDGVSALGELAQSAGRLVSETLASGSPITENSLTNQVFWMERPALRGKKLKAGTPDAMRWLRIRDAVVRPLLRPAPAGPAPAPAQGPGSAAGAVAAPVGPAPQGPGSAAGAAATPAKQADMKPAGEVAAESTAGTGDRYFTQNVGNYRHTDAKGVPQVWLYGSSGANVCNMTSLTMGLVSMAGESEVRAKVIALLRTKGMHGGASVKIGDAFVPLADAIDDPKVADRIRLLDLVTAAAIGPAGSYKTVTDAETIARVARETGIAKQSKTVGGSLSTPKGRALAEQLLASGKRVIVGTVNHYVYLLELRSSGAVVHDPAGARVEPSLKPPLFLHAGGATRIAAEWGRLDETRRKAAVVRASTNAKAAALVGRLVEVWALPAAERQTAIAALPKEHPGHIEMGATNFYANEEFAAHTLRLRVSIDAG